MTAAGIPGERVEAVVPGDLLNPAIRKAAAAELGPDGSWLLLSVLFYSWRAHHDLAQAVLGGPEPHAETPEFAAPTDEFVTVRHLHVLGLTYASAELLATLVHAARQHVSGQTDFLDAYRSAAQLPQLVPKLKDLDLAELRNLIGTEAQIDGALDRLKTERAESNRGAAPTILGPGSLPVTTVDGGIVVPTSSVESLALGRMREGAVGLAEHLLVNISEMQHMVETPPPISGVPLKPQSMRSIDNSFRHGMRLLYHSTVPDARHFSYFGDEEGPASPNQVTVLTPSRKGDHVEFGGVASGPDDTEILRSSLEQLCLRTGQFARALLGAKCDGFEEMILAASTLRLS